jgi:hypothetical protein
MDVADQLELTLLPGARALLRAHARELPQRDDLCGAFCGSLALQAAGLEDHRGEPIDQDAVALAAGSLVSRLQDLSSLPDGERGRRDYRLTPPFIDDGAVSGTTAAGVVRAIGELSGGRLTAIPCAGPWNVTTLGGLFELAAVRERPVTLVANLATRYLWGSRPRTSQLLDYLLDGVQDGPPADWDVGHFVCVVGRLHAPGGTLYAVADTYPSLGDGGVYLQPQERLVAALQRREMAPGGLIAVVAREDARALRSGAGELGLREEVWDNGTLTAETLR